jgi:TPR repeat protein
MISTGARTTTRKTFVVGLGATMVFVVAFTACGMARQGGSAQVVAPALQPADTGADRRALLAADAEGCARAGREACARLAARPLEGMTNGEERQALVPALRTGCTRGVPDACAAVAMYALIDGRDEAAALAQLEGACRAGSGIACARWIEGRAAEAGEDKDKLAALAGEADQACARLGSSVCVTAAQFHAHQIGAGNPAELLARACATGSRWACFQQGIDAAESAGGAAQARTFYERACVAECPPACFNLAYQLMRGEGGARDEGRAWPLVRRACHLGDHTACDLLASTADGRVSPEASRSAYASEAERLAGQLRFCDAGGAESCANAAFTLGHDAEASGRLEEMERALSLLGRACRRGVARGCNILEHVANDAIRACDAGEAGQCLVAGFVYQHGVELPGPPLHASSIPADAAQARAAFSKACSLGRASACARVR